MSTLYDKMKAAGFDPPDHISPGRITRFSTNGKRSDLSGWVYLFPDGQGAVFGCWRSGEQHIWQVNQGRALNAAEQAEFKRKIDAAKEQARQEREAGYQAAAANAQAEWAATKPAPDSHPYLLRKGIEPHMARMDAKGWLVIPVYGADGTIRSLQKIASDGTKRFLGGGRMQQGHIFGLERLKMVLYCCYARAMRRPAVYIRRQVMRFVYASRQVIYAPWLN